MNSKLQRATSDTRFFQGKSVYLLDESGQNLQLFVSYIGSKKSASNNANELIHCFQTVNKTETKKLIKQESNLIDKYNAFKATRHLESRGTWYPKSSLFFDSRDSSINEKPRTSRRLHKSWLAFAIFMLTK